MNFNFNVDIHCHPSGKPYMSGRAHQLHTPFESYDNEMQAWLLNRLNRLIENISNVRLGTQSNFDNLSRGNVRVIIASLTPLERAFLVANVSPGTFINDTLKDLMTEKKTPWEDTLKTKVVNALTGYNVDDLDFVQKNMLNYFQEGLIPEYNYFTKFNNKQNAGKKYTVKFVRNYAQLEQIINADEKTICVLLSIEGAHTLGNDVPKLGPLRREQGKSHKKDQADFTPLINYLNNIAAMKQWEFVPLFITLNHHFWNGLGGHAKSLMALISNIVSQSEGVNEGLKEMGKEVIKLLLKTTNGPRILIDVKHMSPQCRKDFYEFIKVEYWNKNDKFPLICSHTGAVTKSKTLDELIAQNDDKESDSKTNYLHENSINLCAEDVKLIAETKGLIGLQLDEKRTGGHNIIKVIKDDDTLTAADLRLQYVKVLFANLFEMVKAVNAKEGWDILSIGSDYDGLINHLDFYPTTGEMPVLRSDMLKFLKKPVEISQAGFTYTLPVAEIKRLMFGLTPETIIEKIFARNTMEFLKRNFNR